MSKTGVVGLEWGVLSTASAAFSLYVRGEQSSTGCIILFLISCDTPNGHYLQFGGRSGAGVGRPGIRVVAGLFGAGLGFRVLVGIWGLAVAGGGEAGRKEEL